MQLGSLVGDALWAALGLIGIGLLLQLDWLRWPIGVCGVLYLLWLARDSWRSAGEEFSIAPTHQGAPKSALRAGVLLSVTNPQNIAYVAALGTAMSTLGVHELSLRDCAVFLRGRWWRLLRGRFSAQRWWIGCLHAPLLDGRRLRIGCALLRLWRSRWARCATSFHPQKPQRQNHVRRYRRGTD